MFCQILEQQATQIWDYPSDLGAFATSYQVLNTKFFLSKQTAVLDMFVFCILNRESLQNVAQKMWAWIIYFWMHSMHFVQLFSEVNLNKAGFKAPFHEPYSIFYSMSAVCRLFKEPHCPSQTNSSCSCWR